jgi:hypothetical protein
MILVLLLIQLTGPDDQRIDLNPADVVTTRVPRGDEHFAKGIKCLIHTVDGKFIVVKEDCATVRQQLEK